MEEIENIENGPAVLGTVKVDSGNITYEELYDTHKELTNELLDLQVLITTMVRTNSVDIDNDPELLAIVKGLLLTISDAATELVSIQNDWSKGRTGLTGEITEDNETDILGYVKAKSDYIGVGEKLANLSATAVTDILTRLNFDKDLLKEAIKLQDDLISGNLKGE